MRLIELLPAHLYTKIIFLVIYIFSNTKSVQILQVEGEFSTAPSIQPDRDLQLQDFKKNLTLYLELSDHVLLGENTPVFLATKDESQPLGIRYTKIENAWSDNFNHNQNLNQPTFDTPQKHSEKLDTNMKNNNVPKYSPPDIRDMLHFNIQLNIKYGHDKISDLQPQSNSSIKPSIIERSRELTKFKSSKRIKRAMFETVYPKLLVIVDHATYKAHGKNIQNLTKYVAAFWNGVDLRFRDIKHPKIRLHIAGLIIPTEEGAAFYLEKYLTDNNLIEDEKTLKAVSDYFYKEKRFSSNMFDIAVAITNLDLCEMESGVCNPKTRGIGYYGGACKHDSRSTHLSVVFVEDKGGFDGITTAAHELGHILGAPHDGEESPSYIGGPGAKKCNWYDGYIMSSNRLNSNGFHWSPCSIEAMQHFLNKEAYCLREKPIVRAPVKKVLPGKILSRNEQCKLKMNMIECNEIQNECGALRCRQNNLTECSISHSPPAEGSTCNQGICLDGYCTSEVEKKVFTTHQTLI